MKHAHRHPVRALALGAVIVGMAGSAADGSPRRGALPQAPRNKDVLSSAPFVFNADGRQYIDPQAA